MCVLVQDQQLGPVAVETDHRVGPRRVGPEHHSGRAQERERHAVGLGHRVRDQHVGDLGWLVAHLGRNALPDGLQACGCFQRPRLGASRVVQAEVLGLDGSPVCTRGLRQRGERRDHNRKRREDPANHREKVARASGRSGPPSSLSLREAFLVAPRAWSGRLLLRHCVTAFVLPSGCAASLRLLAPARCAPRLPRPRPRSAFQAGAPRCPHETAAPIPRPGPRAGSPRLRETWPPAPAWRIEFPPPECGGLSEGRAAAWRDGSCSYMANGRVAVKIRPAGDRSHRAGACGSRACRSSRWRRWRRPKAEQRGSARRACLLGRTRRRVGGLGSMPSPSDRSKPAGQIIPAKRKREAAGYRLRR